MSSHEIETIVLGVPCTIKFDYQPYEAPERGPEAQYPGCPEEIDITDVLVGGVSVMDWFFSDVSAFEEAVCNERRDQHDQYLEDRAETRWSDLFG